MDYNFASAIESLKKDESFNQFKFLKLTNELLSNPVQESMGRELVIRALNSRECFSNYSVFLKNMVRKAGLFPYLQSEFFDEFNIEDEFVAGLYTPPNQNDFVFHSMQFKIYDLLMHDCNVVLSAPTSMGKSAIVDCILASDKFKKIVLVVPTIALIDETRRRISKKFSNKYQIIHHNAQGAINDKVIYILTQERVNERDDIADIDLFVIDEFYKLSCEIKNNVKRFDERVVSLNVALSKLLTVSRQFYMIGPNIDEVRGLASLKKEYVFFNSDFNTVAINVFEYNIKSRDENNKNIKVIEILKQRKGQTIIYCKSPSVACHISKLIIEARLGKELYDEDYLEWIAQNISEEWDYYKAIKSGIGMHYSALPRAIQQYTVDLFNKGDIRILICTSTIIEGVNTTAENVIIYDNRNGTVSIDKFTHNNIKGRAGRMNVHFVGNVFCLEKIPTPKIEDGIVDIPIGLQDAETPLNLLASIQPEHINEASLNRLNEYFVSEITPKDIIVAHPTYHVDTIKEIYGLIYKLNLDELASMCQIRYISTDQMNIIAECLIITSGGSLRRNNIPNKIDVISARMFNYFNAENYSKYFSKQIKWLKENRSEFSDAINDELKIIRNIYTYTIPQSISLLQDVVNSISERRGIKNRADYSYLMSCFENFHLPANFAALDEMGIPISTLEKLADLEVFLGKNVELLTLIDFISSHAQKFTFLTPMEKKFIQKALD